MTLDVGDCRVTLARWAAEGVRVQCVVTSPPYWGLRDYGTAPLVWGGDPACPHEWGEETMRGFAAAVSDKSTLQQTSGHPGVKMAVDLPRQAALGATRTVSQGAVCACGAWRGSLGLEPTPELYVAHLVDVFRLVRDVLADDGTVWLNLGDSYASSSTYNTTNTLHTVNGWKQDGAKRPNAGVPSGLKPKDLVGIPWRVAFALQADGWWLRSDIIWAKPNPMPESVTDRPTKAHEYLFLLTKAERYYYDAEAIKEPATGHNPGSLGVHEANKFDRSAGNTNGPLHTLTDSRNRRSVWTIATTPYPDAHFATFPPDLVKPCILAGSRPGDVVLDPFMGAGTVAMVAQDLGRAWRGCELSPAYAVFLDARTRQGGLAL